MEWSELWWDLDFCWNLEAQVAGIQALAGPCPSKVPSRTSKVPGDWSRVWAADASRHTARVCVHWLDLCVCAFMCVYTRARPPESHRLMFVLEQWRLSRFGQLLLKVGIKSIKYLSKAGRPWPSIQPHPGQDRIDRLSRRIASPISHTLAWDNLLFLLLSYESNAPNEGGFCLSHCGCSSMPSIGRVFPFSLVFYQYEGKSTRS